MFYDTTKADWKLFQEKLPIWQEKFMKKLNNEYIQLFNFFMNFSCQIGNFS